MLPLDKAMRSSYKQTIVTMLLSATVQYNTIQFRVKNAYGTSVTLQSTTGKQAENR